jgi:hypothetical protein
MYGAEQAIFEMSVARAHRAVFQAQLAAEDANRQGAAEDLRQLLAELTRIGEEALKAPKRPRMWDGRAGSWTVGE